MINNLEIERISEFNRLVDWINKNPDMWNKATAMLSIDSSFEDGTYENILNELHEQQFYQIILLILHSQNYIIREAFERGTFETLFTRSDKTLLDELIKSVISNLKKLQ